MKNRGGGICWYCDELEAQARGDVGHQAFPTAPCAALLAALHRRSVGMLPCCARVGWLRSNRSHGCTDDRPEFCVELILDIDQIRQIDAAAMGLPIRDSRSAAVWG